jgi:alcohol dehydrogenase
MERAASTGFDFAPRTRVVFGSGSLARLGALARELGAGRVLLVSDPGLLAAGHVARALDSLEEAGCHVLPFTEAREDPDARDVARCAEAARPAAPELFVALGGGSSIDTAKGAAMLLANGGRMQDYWGFGKTRAPLLPLVAVPTTAGTGSEVQSYALIADETSGQKMACGAADAAPRVALLDPELTLSCPPLVTACAGLDALGHALETAVTRKRSEFSALFSRAAFRLLARHFAGVLARPADPEARAGMLLGACWAGLAIEHSMLGAAHSLANPLSARCGLVHGLAVGLVLAAVVRFNAEDPLARARYAELAQDAGLCAREASDAAAVTALGAFLEGCLAEAGIARDLRAHGVAAQRLPALAEEASRQWTAQFNPRAVGAAELEGLLAAAHDGS